MLGVVGSCACSAMGFIPSLVGSPGGDPLAAVHQCSAENLNDQDDGEGKKPYHDVFTWAIIGMCFHTTPIKSKGIGTCIEVTVTQNQLNKQTKVPWGPLGLGTENYTIAR